MKVRTARFIAMTTLFFTLLPSGIALMLLIQTLNAPVPDSWGIRGFAILFAVVCGLVGFLIAWRRPDNSIGWLFATAAVLSGIQAAGDEYGTYAVLSEPPLPLGYTATWIEDWIWVPAMGILTVYVPLLFPSGRLLSPRWRLVGWGATVPIALATVGSAALMEGVYAAQGGVDLRSPAWAEPVFVAGMMPLIGCMGLAATSLVFRARRATGVERQQLKWIASAAALVALVFPLQMLPMPIGGNPKIGEGLLILAVLLVPVAAGLAILRYRLYDIDIVINRTLVYGPLSAILAGVYIASIGLFQRIFASITGDWSEPAVVLTTLIVVALFTPIRNRLQTVVDKRFKTAPRDPLHDVREMAQQVGSVLEALDGERVARRFLERSVGALEAEGGALSLRRNGGLDAVHTHGDWKGDAALVTDIVHNGIAVGRLALGPRRDGRGYRPEDAKVLEECGGLIAGALVEDRAGAKNAL